MKDAHNTKPKVVIIKGNPEKMKGMEQLAHAYYDAIANYVEGLGFLVEMDAGEPKTCPASDSVFWIAHSRGVDRERCIPQKDQWRFLKFGTTDGVVHPKDARWQRTVSNHVTSTQLPPKEHFEFTDAQRQAIDEVVRKL